MSGLPDTMCQTDLSVTLTGTPIGGTFTGQGVTGNVFNPANASLGSVTVTYNYTDANGCSNSATSTVEAVEICPGINELSGFDNLAIYPNPFSNVINVEFTASDNLDIDVRLIDVVGKVHSASNYSVVTGANKLVISTDVNMAIGIYFIEITSGYELSSFKLLRVK